MSEQGKDYGGFKPPEPVWDQIGLSRRDESQNTNGSNAPEPKVNEDLAWDMAHAEKPRRDEIKRLQEAADFYQEQRELDEDFGRDVESEAQEEVSDYYAEIDTQKALAKAVVEEVENTATDNGSDSTKSQQDEPETYLENKKKAEIIAYATKPIEESIVQDRHEVVNLLAKAGEYEQALPVAKQRTEEIKNRREYVDNLAQQVAETYDEVHKY